MDWSIVQKLALALGMGLLVGFQREWTAPHVAGIRTFALITLFGAVMGLLFSALGGWMIAAGVVAVTLMLAWPTSARQRGVRLSHKPHDSTFDGTLIDEMSLWDSRALYLWQVTTSGEQPQETKVWRHVVVRTCGRQTCEILRATANLFLSNELAIRGQVCGFVS